jgi:hypothetical protein
LKALSVIAVDFLFDNSQARTYFNPRNITHPPANATVTTPFMKTPNTARSGNLFNQIFEQYPIVVDNLKRYLHGYIQDRGL